ncbi:hypothetical protein [Novosphingobium jiangmenense]|uniref:Uncharacterized protein n=1 Tax=Novosphingobium jiangmenense TaxID=2791981 RepID=A0ABS0HHH4_9SPHN|nr:hypothetical protein [Novosphingobium jiangmenense]MBF9151710.1 hypothetical protein [Novosphingobium jiangmenense]
MEGAIESGAEIEQLHALLSAHFAGLRAERGDAPIYLFEHDFDNADLKMLSAAVRSSLARYPIESHWWVPRHLPLLVAATEIGYVYRGTGTDFWPIFGEQLGQTSLGDRGALSSLFRQSVARLGLAQPPETPWNFAFCHIAWPVLHAILPIELHQPLARAVRDVRSHIDLGASDAELIAPVRNRARLAGGVRLIAWLEDHYTAAAVIRQLLQPSGNHGITSSALKRIAADLAQNESANNALREARKRQRALEAQPKVRPRRRAEIEPKFAPLMLRKIEQRLSLALKIPQMEQAARDGARSALDAIRWRAFLWGDGRPVPGRNIFSDFPLPVQIDVFPEPDTPLIADVAALPIAQQAKDFLGSLRVASAAPILFSDFSDDGDALQRTGAVIADSGHCIVLVGPVQTAPPEAEQLGRVAGLRGYRLDVADPANQAWLASMGFAVRKTTRFSWIGDAEIEQHRPIRRFRVGSFIAFELSSPGGNCEARLTAPDGNQSVLSGTDTLLAGFAAKDVGLYRLRYGAGEEQLFEVIAVDDALRLLTIDIDAGTASTTDLADRQITLRFDSVATVQEAELQLMLYCDGRAVKVVREILPDTPCRLGGDHMIWDHLLDTDTVEQLLSARRAELCLTVAGLVETSFAFEQATAPFAWSKQADGQLVASDESGNLEVFAAVPQQPLMLAPGTNFATIDDVKLFRAGHGRPLQTGGYCVGPRIWRLGDAPSARKPDRLLRQFEVARARDCEADGRNIVDALIGWAAAGVDHPVTQFRRGQIVRQLEGWMVEQICGHAWSQRENALAEHKGRSFVEAFLAACARLNIGYCSLQMSRAQRALLDRILMRLIDARALPITLDTSREPIEEDVGVALDEVFYDAYVALADDIESVGDMCPFNLDDDVDVGEVSENWDKALRAAAREAALIELVDLLRPLDAGDTLSLADFESMLPDDVVDLLNDWISKNRPPHHARQWNRDLVESAYWLFARPAVAARLSWKAAAERLLADRFSARAIRYAALRAGTSLRVE